MITVGSKVRLLPNYKRLKELRATFGAVGWIVLEEGNPACFEGRFGYYIESPTAYGTDLDLDWERHKRWVRPEDIELTSHP